MVNQQWGPPPPPPSSHRAADRPKPKAPWLAGVATLTALSLAAAGTSAYVFLTAGDAQAAGATPKGATATTAPAAPGATVPGWGTPIDKAKTKPARTPQTPMGTGTSEENIAASTHKIGDAVMFNNQTAIRVDGFSPATLWPASAADLTLAKWRKKIRIFAIHYTYTNFSSAPVGVRGLGGLRPLPYDPGIKWPTGQEFPQVTYSTSAVLPSGIAANYWPAREAPERAEGGGAAAGPGQSVAGGYMVAPGQTVKGVFVTLDVRPKGSKFRIEGGVYRQEGQAWFAATTP